MNIKVSCLFISSLLGVNLADARAERVHIDSESEAVRRPGLGFVLGVSGSALSSVGAALAPSRAALRIGLPQGISLEPSVAYYRQDAGPFGLQEALGTHARVRLPIATREKTELVVIGEGSAFFAGSDRAYSLSWGLGIERFLVPDFSLGLDATSGVLSHDSGTDSWSVGPLGDFQMSVQAALYF